MSGKMVKNKRKILIFLIISLLLIISGLIFVFSNTKVVMETFTTIRKAFISPVTEDIEVEEHTINLILKELDNVSKVSLTGNKVKVSGTDTDLKFNYFEPQTNNIINLDNEGNVEIPDTGIKLKIDGVKQGKKYEINIEQKATLEGYNSNFKSIVIEINAENEDITTKILRIVNREDQVIEGSSENLAICMYEEENKEIKITGNENLVIEYVYSEGKNLSAQELQNAEWNEYDGISKISIEKNGYLYTRAKDKDGRYSEISSIKISNIDKNAPSIAVEKEEPNERKDKTTLSVKLSDIEETTEYGKSGIYGYAITREETEPQEYIRIRNK